MKKTLLATVAVAAVVGFTTMATAQNAMDSKGAAKPAGAAEQKSVAPGGSGGAMTHQQPGAQMLAPRATQGATQDAKPEQRMGDEQKSQTTPPQRGAEEEQKSTTPPQRGAEEEQKSTTPPQRGAEEEQKSKTPQRAESEHGTDQKKAQEEREPAQKGAQGEAAKPSVSQSNKAQGNANQQNAGKAAGGKVQLSQDQRSKIHSLLGRSEAASVRTNVNFNIAVGVTIPQDVHVEVLPEDVVEVVPQYEGYEYVMVGDEILIIDPDSSEIVAIIEV